MSDEPTVAFTKVSDMPNVRLTIVSAHIELIDVNEDNGEVSIVKVDRAGREISRTVAIEALNNYHNKETD